MLHLEYPLVHRTVSSQCPPFWEPWRSICWDPVELYCRDLDQFSPAVVSIRIWVGVSEDLIWQELFLWNCNIKRGRQKTEQCHVLVSSRLVYLKVHSPTFVSFKNFLSTLAFISINTCLKSSFLFHCENYLLILSIYCLHYTCYGRIKHNLTIHHIPFSVPFAFFRFPTDILYSALWLLSCRCVDVSWTVWMRACLPVDQKCFASYGGSWWKKLKPGKEFR